MMAVRTGPSSPASSAMPASFSVGSAARSTGASTMAAAGARPALAPCLRARARNVKRLRPRLARRGRRSQTFVEPRDFVGELGAARIDRRWTDDDGRRDRAIPKWRRSQHAASAAPTTPIVAVRFKFIGQVRDRRLARDRSARIVARALYGCVIIRRAPCIDWFESRSASSTQHRRSHPRKIRIDATPRQTARGPRRPADDRARLPPRRGVAARLAGHRRHRRSPHRHARRRLRRQGAAHESDARDRHRSPRRSRDDAGRRHHRQRAG